MAVRRALIIALVTAVVPLVSGLSAQADEAATTCSSGVPGDVNGDGYAEVAVGELGHDDDAGAIHVFYGSATGLVTDSTGSAHDDQLFDQDTPGIPGAEASGNAFGTAAALADFNADGCADLVIGASGERHRSGSVTVLYGSPAGLRTAGAQRFTVSALFGIAEGERCRPPIDNETGATCEAFGQRLATGDLNGDGADDLVAAAPRLGLPDHPGAGGIAVLLGDRTGLGHGSTPATLITASTAGVPGAAVTDAGFGSALAIGDFDGTGGRELAVGDTDDHVDVLHGNTGFRRVSGERFTPKTRGVAGTDGAFGYALAAGDVDGDGRDDLAVGAPWNSTGGAVTLLRGGPDGLTTAHSQRWTRQSAGVEGPGGDWDEFGSALAMGRLDTDRRADLVIGAPFADVGSARAAGTVTLLRGGPDGLTTAGTGGRMFSQDTPGVSDKAEGEDGFGGSLIVSAVAGGDQSSVIIGLTGESRAGYEDAGYLHALGRAADGPSGEGSIGFDLSSHGVKGTIASYSRFGALDGSEGP